MVLANPKYTPCPSPPYSHSYIPSAETRASPCNVCCCWSVLWCVSESTDCLDTTDCCLVGCFRGLSLPRRCPKRAIRALICMSCVHVCDCVVILFFCCVCTCAWALTMSVTSQHIHSRPANLQHTESSTGIDCATIITPKCPVSLLVNPNCSYRTSWAILWFVAQGLLEPTNLW